MGLQSGQLMLGEKVLTEYGDLVLTTHRIRLDSSNSGKAQIVSIMLEEVSSCSTDYNSHQFLLIFVVLLFVIAFLQPPGIVNPNHVPACVILGCVFLLAFFWTQTQDLTISSAKGSIRVNAKSMGMDKARKFIDTLETAKNERYTTTRP